MTDVAAVLPRKRPPRAPAVPTFVRLGSSFVAVSVAMTSLLTVVAAVEATSISPSAAVKAAVAFFLLGVAGAATLARCRAQRRALEIRTVYLLYTALGYGLLSLAWTSQQTGTAGRVQQPGIPFALLLALLGTVAWAIGYGMLRCHGAKRLAVWCRTVAAPGEVWDVRFPAVAVVLYSVGLGARILQIRGGSYSYLADPRSLIANPSSLGQLLATGERLTLIAVTVASVHVSRHSRTLWPKAILAVLVLVEVASGAYGGTKSALVFIVVSVAIPFLAKRPRAPVFAAMLAIFFFAIATSFTEAYRERVVTGSARLSGTAAREALTSAAAETLGPGSVVDSVVGGLDTLAKRLRQVDNVAVVAQRTPSDIPYRPTLALVSDPVLTFVPRAVWPDKPVRTTGLDFSREYYDLPSEMYTASAVTVIGDLYRHGGVLVIAVGMALVGATMHYADRFWHPAADLRLSLLFAGAFIEFINLETDFASLVSSLVVAVGVSIAVTRFAFAHSLGTTRA